MQKRILRIILLSVIILNGCDDPQIVSNPQPNTNPEPYPQPQPENEPEHQPSLTIKWERPVERENGEQLFLYEIGGYEVLFKEVNDSYYKTIIIEDGIITEFSLPISASGSYEVKIAAFDTDNLYSKYSDTVILDSD